ncbi:SNF2 family N-terminal domain-containing protein [Parachaetomium inaequale]|uniref:SNF2 family N-terminal domain-containing protein n=1 Tax=Parachaetomium inaequale TaxID=2588326 RepID=A0AAN6PNE2_9PEZI|nr:SNF2 family N-terminal domain-containing protein [Parachaetomium inaequale]
MAAMLTAIGLRRAALIVLIVLDVGCESSRVCVSRVSEQRTLEGVAEWYLMRKPGSSFAVQPQNNLKSDTKPEFARTNKPNEEKRNNTRPRKSRAELRQSFYDLIQSTTISYSSSSPNTPNGRPAPDPEPDSMARLRKDSFSDDDLEALSSQAANMSLGPGAQTPLRQTSKPNSEVVDLTDSPIPTIRTPAAATPTPNFGHPTKLAPRFGQRTDNHNHMFIQRKTRPEFHSNMYRSSGPLKPKTESKKAPALQMFSSMSEDAQPAYQYTQPAGAYGDKVFYTDPTKASADLKALLEGSMEDEEEESEEPKPEGDKPKEETIEDGTLEGIKVKLLPHQVEGVKWMRGREVGPHKKGKVTKGGILADDMGLGKTLQSISLIVSNPMPGPEDEGWKKHFDQVKRATLVVAPLALIRQWEAEIKDKVAKDHELSVCVHHGPQRTKDPKVLGKYDVVITTYQILVSEHGNSNPDPTKGPQAGCFGIHWFRVILDEAHSIKNRNAKATKACYALRSEFRWCLTGTPMQNNLDELQSLVHFLRIPPYDDLAEWRTNIDGPMKGGKGHIAIRRLHTLLRCFMKRRTKDILKEEGALVAGGKKALEAAAAKAKEEGREEADMPKPAFKVTQRKVVTVETQFSEAEREFYDKLEARADKSLEKMMKGKVNYANALVLLLRLRQACNHPRLSETNLDKDSDALATDTAPQPRAGGADDLDDLADAFGGMGIQTKQCEMCLNDLNKKEVAAGFVRCAECIESLQKVNNESPDRKKPKKDSRRISVVEEEIKIEKMAKRKPKGRRIITDSDDEEEEMEGSWLVSEDERGALRLGKAGGEEDENAEGGGEDIASEDSDHSSDEDDGSQLDSFIVNDEEVPEGDQPGSGSDSDSDDETFVSPAPPSDDEPESSEAESISESELLSEIDSDSDDDDLPVKRHGHRSNAKPPSSKTKPSRTSTGATTSNSVMTSAKTRELLSLLRKEAPAHKFIVFSQFTSMLDLIEPFLRAQPGLKAVRYDGKMANDAREAALRALRTDPHTRILLCSLKCGSLGLNLTAATRVVIVEPFWNPFVEEQAIDRVHRLTQTVDVVVYKLTVADTVEARILELQEKKRRLAEATIEGGMRRKGKGQLKLGLQEILELFKHDARASLGGGGDDAGGDPGRDKVVVGDVGWMSRRGGGGGQKRKEHEVFGRRW